MKPEKTDKDLLLILGVLTSDGVLNEQQFKTIRGQVLAGDSAGAIKGLRKIIRRCGGLKQETYKHIGAALEIPAVMFRD